MSIVLGMEFLSQRCYRRNYDIKNLGDVSGDGIDDLFFRAQKTSVSSSYTLPAKSLIYVGGLN